MYTADVKKKKKKVKAFILLNAIVLFPLRAGFELSPRLLFFLFRLQR